MTTVVFDLGGVVLQWEPRRAYEQVLAPERVGPFMEKIDFASWNRTNDAGRPFAEGERALIERFPDEAHSVLAYRRHFPHTLTGMVPGTGAVIAELAAAGVRLVALTNWSHETFPHAQQRFGLLRRFEAILVSGAEQLAKPDPAIFALAVERFSLDPAETFFVDDSPANVAAAGEAGLTALPFTDADRLRADLEAAGVLGPRRVPSEPVFHVADAAAWRQAEAGAPYPWSSRGLSYDHEGFVHCAFTEQLPQVLDRYYTDVPWSDLALLELDPAALPVVVEDLGAGPFPHVFAPLTPAAVRRVHSGLD